MLDTVPWGFWGYVLDTVHWGAVGDKILYTGGLWGIR